MTKVASYTVRHLIDDRVSITLSLKEAFDVIPGQRSENDYTVVRACKIPFQEDEKAARALVGTMLEGKIVRVQSVRYPILCRVTGEIIHLDFEYGYLPPGETKIIGQTKVLTVKPKPIYEQCPW